MFYDGELICDSITMRNEYRLEEHQLNMMILENYYNVLTESQEILQENFVKNIFSKIIEFIKNMWNKLKGIFSSKGDSSKGESKKVEEKIDEMKKKKPDVPKHLQSVKSDVDFESYLDKNSINIMSKIDGVMRDVMSEELVEEESLINMKSKYMGELFDLHTSDVEKEFKELIDTSKYTETDETTYDLPKLEKVAKELQKRAITLSDCSKKVENTHKFTINYIAKLKKESEEFEKNYPNIEKDEEYGNFYYQKKEIKENIIKAQAMEYLLFKSNQYILFNITMTNSFILKVKSLLNKLDSTMGKYEGESDDTSDIQGTIEDRIVRKKANGEEAMRLSKNKYEKQKNELKELFEIPSYTAAMLTKYSSYIKDVNEGYVDYVSMYIDIETQRDEIAEFIELGKKHIPNAIREITKGNLTSNPTEIREYMSDTFLKKAGNTVNIEIDESKYKKSSVKFSQLLIDLKKSERMPSVNERPMRKESYDNDIKKIIDSKAKANPKFKTIIEAYGLVLCGKMSLYISKHNTLLGDGRDIATKKIPNQSEALGRRAVKQFLADKKKKINIKID